MIKGSKRSKSFHFLDKFIFLTLLAMVLALFAASCKHRPGIGYNQGYSPEQPIPYDHSLHAGTYKIPCLYCHAGAEVSRHALVPSINICMNCHLTVATDKPNIQLLSDAYANDKPIQWVKVHMLPDFVNFNHRRHVLKGVACQTCHGPIETMKRVSQFSDLSMGWCINCHRQPENNAPLNCTTCHQ